MNCTTQNLILASIAVSARIRKDAGGIEELAADIREHGLINPITVMDCGDSRYQLIAGLRRLNAMISLGGKEIRATILSPMQADEVLSMEYAENVQRRDFTVAEQLEYAEKIKVIEQAKALERKSVFARAGYEMTTAPQDRDNCPYPEKGRAKEAIAKRAGFTSYKQYERAETVAAKRPDLLERIDAGEATISGAYKQAINELKPEPKAAVSPPYISVKIPATAKQNASDQVARAGHERLMKNPVYSELWANWQKAVADTNIAVTELTFRSQGYENRIRNYQENVNALSRRCDALEAENAALRARLGETEVAT